MTRRIVALLAFLVVGICLGIAVTRIDWTSFKISQANCDRVLTGMTADEVEAILGRPTGYVDLGAGGGGEDRRLAEAKAATAAVWIAGARGIITVGYDNRGRVVYKDCLWLRH
jgi:hypothetical protein